MGWTREEYNTIQEMVKRIRKLERRLDVAELLIATLEDGLTNIESQTNMADWTPEQWKKFLEPFINTGEAIKKHTHENDQQGGPCFAEKGAKLLGDGSDEQIF